MLLCACVVCFGMSVLDLKGIAMVTNEDMVPQLTEQPRNRESLSQYSEEGTSGSTLHH